MSISDTVHALIQEHMDDGAIPGVLDPTLTDTRETLLCLALTDQIAVVQAASTAQKRPSRYRAYAHASLAQRAQHDRWKASWYALLDERGISRQEADAVLDIST